MKLSKVFACLLSGFLCATLHADDPARFDLTGPKIEIRVTRGAVTLPIAQVPNLQPGDKLWIKADLPPTQSNHLLIIVAFLRGTTNEPPDNWFTPIETWTKKTTEGTTVVVPQEAQQAVLFIAPETAGDFKTLRSAVKGKPGLFIRADADLNAASFQQQRIQHYLAAMKEISDSNEKTILDHSAKLASTLALKPNEDCFKQPVEQQVNCLTLTSAPLLLDDGHGQSIAEALSSGASSDFINAAATTPLAGAGVYSAYVGAIVDLVHLASLLGTAQYQYIPGLAFPESDTLNVKLNAPPSFHNPKSVIVIGLPAIQKAILPPLHPHDPNQVACLLQPKMIIPLEGAPLVFSTSFAHDLVLHLNRTGTATNLPLAPDAFEGGLIVAKAEQRRPLNDTLTKGPNAKTNIKVGSSTDTLITGTIRGYWGFDPFEGVTVTLQQVDSKHWKILGNTQLMAGKDNHLLLEGDATACVEHIALTTGQAQDVNVSFKPATEDDERAAATGKNGDEDDKPEPEAKAAKADKSAKAPASPAKPEAKLIKNALALDLPMTKIEPGGYSLEIKQYGAASQDKVPLTAYNADIHFDSLKLHTGDSTAVLAGQGLDNVTSVEIAGKTFKPAPAADDAKTLTLQADSGVAPKDGSQARVKLKDGRTLPVKISVAAARPGLKLLSFTATPADMPGTLAVTLGARNDIPLNGRLTFVVQTADVFPRSQSIEVATADASVETSLSIAGNTLILQDERTAVATLDPLKAFGQSAFGKLRMRPIAGDGTAGDWTPLGTLVRTPRITGIACTTTDAPTCTAAGANFFLVQSFAAAKDFAKPVDVPTGFADSSFQVPTPADGSTLYLKLRDDPTAIASITLPTPVPQPVPQAVPQPAPQSAPQPATPTAVPTPAATTPPATAPVATPPAAKTPGAAPPAATTPAATKPAAATPASPAPSAPPPAR
jgi:hypothetical protein